MGNGDKFIEREQAKDLRGQSWTLQEIADELGVAKAPVSVWVRDVDVVPNPATNHRPHQVVTAGVRRLASRRVRLR